VQACPQETNHHPSPFGEQSFTNWSRNLAARQISRSGPLYSLKFYAAKIKQFFK
jgi:hypothetical protein